MALKGEKALRRGWISSSSVSSAITGKGRLDGTFSASPLTSRVSGSEKGTFARGDAARHFHAGKITRPP